ncbi:hypothetical protein MVES1_003865 [Malassezia vespertilionis]|uniref:Restriction endonuclease type IV Mrr domain-containing protein n=1 Tax=Malassezia vespertilionis TaxID=2020962 RepID=A0A2N1J7P9_9BASI|nr:uncharacterized protein MVES1_003865 [Malassezia vespertilionis]PKI82585.1 hypothetical protein MVES_003422 [Malassezia vespertilionis]WFD08489.1 hypothetical protein MVES1_003865 [Malassezia vespertilionis]
MTTRGTAYELACLHKLQTWLGMCIYRTGGAGDRGIDLCGWWSPLVLRSEARTSIHDRMRVLVQCKAEAKPVGPGIVRELEGTLIRAVWDKLVPLEAVALPGAEEDVPIAARDAPLLGVLTSVSGFSKHALLHARSSRIPMLLLHLAAHDPSFERLVCTGFVWNDALAGSNGLLGGRCEVGWIDAPRAKGQKHAMSHAVLYRDGVAVA